MAILFQIKIRYFLKIRINNKCDGGSEKETTEQNDFCHARKFKKLTKLWIFKYLEVKNVVLSYNGLNFDNF